jgi:hypothetical protein
VALAAYLVVVLYLWAACYFGPTNQIAGVGEKLKKAPGEVKAAVEAGYAQLNLGLKATSAGLKSLSGAQQEKLLVTMEHERNLLQGSRADAIIAMKEAEQEAGRLVDLSQGQRK